MNRILLILVFIFSFVFSFGQPIVPRSNGSLTVQDSNWFAGNSMRVPLFFDTAHANTNRPSLDSMGKIIFTRDVNWFWGRVYIPGTSSHMWVPFANPSTNLNVNCGNSIGGHIVTRDSALTFDVTGGPYVLCCDGIPRATNFTTVTLAQGDSLNPRWDAIILDSNGVHVIQGTPDPNPTFPQINSCQILLTYVNILTGQMVPAGITQTVIYDEFVQGEWDSLRRSLITVDSLNPNFPIHGLVAAYVHNYSGINYFEFHTDTAIDLNNYSALKFYIRDSSAVRVSISWYLDNQPQTPPVLAPVQTFNLNNYQVIVMPISSWRFTQNSTLANTVRFSISAVNPLDAKGLYIDWVQLQGGILITNTSTTGLQSFSATGIDAVGTTVNNPNGPNTQLVLTKPLQPPYTVYANDSSANAPFRPTAVNLGTPMITGLLDPIHIQPSTVEGDILITENNGGNLVTVWDGGGTDTTFVKNWLRRYTDPNSFNDTLVFGAQNRDTSVLSFNTYTSLSSFFWDVTHGLGDIFKIAANGTNNAFITIDSARFEEGYSGTAIAAANNLTLTNDANVFTISGATQINAITTANWQAGSQVKLVFTGTPLIKHNTAGGAGTSPILLASSIDYQTAAQDVLSLVYDGTNWHETARKQSGGSTLETLQQVFNTEVGGSILTKDDTVQLNTHGLKFIDTASGTNAISIFQRGTSGIALSISNLATSNNAASITSSNGSGGLAVTTTATPASNTRPTIIVTQSTVQGNASADGIQVNFTGATNGILNSNAGGLDVFSTVGVAGIFRVDSSSATAIAPILELYRSRSAGAPSNGVGESIDFLVRTSVAAKLSNQLISEWIDATDATRTSQLDITGVNSAATNTIMSAYGSGVVGIGISSTPYNSTRLDVVDNSVGGASIANMSSTSTGAASNVQKVLNISLSGANGTASQTTYGAYISNTHTGTTPVNIGTYSEASGTAASKAVYGNNTGSGAGVYGNGFWGVYGTSSVADAIHGVATSSATGVYGETVSGLASQFVSNPSSTNTVSTITEFVRSTSGTATNGIGVSIDFKIEGSTGATALSNQIESIWSDATNATRTSQLVITGVNSTVTNNIISFEGNQRVLFIGRGEYAKGANVSSAGDLTLGLDGNVFHITGATTINAIITANWQAGSEIILIFDSNPTVKNNTAGGAGTAKMLLAGGVDFSATSNDVLDLVYDGTSFFERSRSVN